MISVVVVARNEGQQLRECLQSTANLADEMVVIDLGSTDGTVTIAGSMGARVKKHAAVDYVEAIRNFSIAQARGDWVLILDPDERLSSGLAVMLKKLTDNSPAAAVNIPRKNIFFGRWISHTNFWPDRQVRFFKKGRVTWPERLHAYPIVNGETIDLPADPELAIVHLGYASKSAFIIRQNRYASLEAAYRYKRGQRFSLVDCLWEPLREFLVRFVKYRGYLDGEAGVFLVLALMVYRLRISWKLLRFIAAGGL
jgi:glycosyltransferase involved in cell wall biosynthesis